LLVGMYTWADINCLHPLSIIRTYNADDVTKIYYI
jgi:hypothetical protein